ncbi:MAG: hypothetical protein JNN26_27090 [Candidatus Obscuribacter sp.]|nr:hypothetical protein [Candidatus Obscuribacter sp.]
MKTKKKRLDSSFFLDFSLKEKAMSNSSYTLLSNSTDKLDVTVPVKELESTAAMGNSYNDALKKRYIQIAIAVSLYW